MRDALASAVEMALLAEPSSQPGSSPGSAVLPRASERYVLGDELASGGMASVHLGRLIGAGGFARTVAIKRLHASYAKDPDFCTMFLDEARVTSRVSHPNVVATLDVVQQQGEMFLVMDYVQGDTLSHLWGTTRAQGPQGRIPPRVAVAIIVGALHGLQAAHEATRESGEPLGIVHRDVSPQNILVGIDGVPRVADFGIARAEGRSHQTRDGVIKGKAPYMAPEQLRGQPMDHRVDLYAAAVVLWEVLAGERLFVGDSMAETMTRVLEQPVEPPSRFSPDLPAALDAVIQKGLARKPGDRFASGREMAMALEAALPAASALEVGTWVRQTVGSTLQTRAAKVTEMERRRYEDAASFVSGDATIIAAADVVRDAARSRRRTAGLGFAAVAVLLVGFLGARRLVTASSVEVDVRNDVTANRAAATESVASAASPLAMTVDAASASAPIAETTAASATPPPAKVAPRRGRRQAATSSGIASPPPDCTPPYTLTSDGLRIPKAACVGAP